ncbi:tudor domain-containing 6-like isoform X2 [Oratosquilla oratoria]
MTDSVISKSVVDSRESYDTNGVKVSLLNKGRETLKVVHVTDDGIVWVQQGAQEDDLNALMDELDSYCTGEGMESIVMCAEVETEKVYGCSYEFDEGWYRARVVKLLEGKMCEVHYIDYGNSEMVSYASLRVLPPHLLRLEPQAIGCILKGWKPSVMSVEKLKSLADIFKIEGQLNESTGEYKYLENVMVGGEPFITFPNDLNCKVDVPVNQECKDSDKSLANLGSTVDDDDVFVRDNGNYSNLNGSKPDELSLSKNSTMPLSCEREGFSLVAALNDFKKKNGNKIGNGTILPAVKSPSLKKDKERQNVELEELAVVHVSKDGTVWVQKCVQEEALNSMMDELHNFCVESEESLAYGEVIEGELYGCLFEGDGGWYRACVTKILDEESCKVHYIDYGNAETVLYESLRALPANLHKLKPQAIGCKLGGMESLLDMDKLKELLEVTDIKGQIMEFKDEKKCLENLLVNGQPFIEISGGQDCGLDILPDQKSLKLENAKNELQCNKVVKEDTYDFSGFTTEEMLSSKEITRMHKSCFGRSEFKDKIPQNETLDSEDADPFVLDKRRDSPRVPLEQFEVAHISLDGVVWVQRYAQKLALKSLMDELQNYFVEDQNSIKVKDVIEGNIYGCLYEVDQIWYRVCRKRVLSDGKVEAHYIDYGFTGTVSSEVLHELPECFHKLEPQAIGCHLSGLKPSSLDFDKLLGLLEGYEICGQLNESSGTYKCLDNVVIDGKSLIAFAYAQDCGIDISCRQSVRSHPIASCTESARLNIHTEIAKGSSGKNFHDDIEQNKSAPNQTLEVTSSRSLVSVLETESYNAREEMEEYDKCNAIISEKLAVVYISSDGIVWVQKCSREQALLSLMDELHMHCSQDDESLLHEELKEGELYGCLYEADEGWYRARVLSLLDDEKCMVHYIDYGNVESTYCEALRELPAYFLELEPQAIGCILRVSGCPQVSVQKLMELTEASEVYGQIKEGEGEYKDLEEVIVDGKPFLSEELVNEINTSHNQSIMDCRNTDGISRDKIITEESGNGARDGSTNEPNEMHLNEATSVYTQESSSVEAKLSDVSLIDKAKRDYRNTKVMNSDKSDTVPEEDSVECHSGVSEKLVFVHLSSDGIVWVHKCSQEEELNSLMDEVHAHCEGISETTQLEVQKGELYGCLYNVDDCWYRGRVVNVLDDKRCEVHYIDYGNTDIVSTDVLRNLPEALCGLKPLAIGCKLRETTKISVDKLKSLVKEGSEIEGQVVEVSNEYSYLEKIMIDGKPVLASQEQTRNSCTSAISLETTDGAISEENNQSCDVVVLLSEESELGTKDLNTKFSSLKLDGELGNRLERIEVPHNTEPSQLSLKEGKGLDVEQEQLVVVCVSLDGIVWVQRCAQEDVIYSIMNELESQCASDGNTVTFEEVEEKKLYGCIYEEDQSWYRVRVVKLIDVDRCEVHYIDYGNSETVLYKALRVLPAPFLSIEPQAVGCELSGFKSSLNVKKLKGLLEEMQIHAIIKEGTGKFKKLDKIVINDKPFSAFVNDHSLAIDLLSSDSRTLSDAGDESTRNSSNIIDSDDTSFCSGNLPVPLTPEKARSLDEKSSSVSLKNGNSHGVDLKVMEERVESCPLGLKGNTKFPDEVVEKLKVVHVSSDGLVWVQRSAQEKALHSLMNELNSCAAGDEQILTCDEIEEGNLYGYICKAEKKLYRVCVLTRLSDGCKVHFIDYGNKETVSYERLRMLPTSILGIDPQAISCRIKGLKLDISLPHQVQELMLGSDIMGKIKGTDGDLKYLEEVTIDGEQFLPSLDYNEKMEKDDESMYEKETDLESENRDGLSSNVHLCKERNSLEIVDIMEVDFSSSTRAPMSMSTPKIQQGPTETKEKMFKFETNFEMEEASEDVGKFNDKESHASSLDDSVLESLTVVHVSCDKIVWVQKCSHDETLYSMMDQLYHYCTNDSKIVKCEDLKLGNTYGCFSEAYECWYRASVIAILDDGKCEVSYIDYGNVETVSCEVLRDLPSLLGNLDPYVVPCMLDGLDLGSQEVKELMKLTFATDVKGRIKEAESPYKKLIDLQIEGKPFLLWSKHEHGSEFPHKVYISNSEGARNDRNGEKEMNNENIEQDFGQSPVSSVVVGSVPRPDSRMVLHKEFRTLNEVTDLEEQIQSSDGLGKDSASHFDPDSLEVDQDNIYSKQEEHDTYTDYDTYFEEDGKPLEDTSLLYQEALVSRQEGSQCQRDVECDKKSDASGECSQSVVRENVEEPQWYDGFIVHLETSPLALWLQTNNACHYLNKWESLTPDDLENFEKLTIIKVGAKCLAPLWYTTQRACVKRIFTGDDDHVQVFYIDQGKNGVVLKDDLWVLPSHMESVPPLAFKRLLPIFVPPVCESYVLTLLRDTVINKKCLCVDLNGVNGTPIFEDSYGNIGVSVWTEVGEVIRFLSVSNLGTVWANPKLDKISRLLALQAEKNTKTTDDK